MLMFHDIFWDIFEKKIKIIGTDDSDVYVLVYYESVYNMYMYE